MNGRSRADAFLVLASVAGAVVFLLPIVVAPLSVAYTPGSTYTDVLNAHLPSALFLNRTLRLWGEIPLWNPTILSGMPFAADPLSGLWYPPLWLAAALPQPLTFNLLTVLHLAWAGVGMGLFLRRQDLSPTAAVVGGVAFLGSPKLIGHIGLGHATLTYAVAWMPWLLVLAHESMRVLAEWPGKSLRWAALLGAALGLVFLIDPRWAIPSAVLTASFTAYLWLRHPVDTRGKARYALGAAAACAMAAIGVAAALAIPLVEWLGLSTRAGLESESSSFALPFSHLIGLLVPQFGAWPEWIASAGIVLLILALIGVASRAPAVGFWTGWAVAGWILALGESTPIGAGLRLIPLWDMMRVPPRWLFVSALALAILGGIGAEAILQRDPDRRRRFSLAAFPLVVAIMAAGLGVLAMRPPGSPAGGMLLAGPAAAVLGFVLLALGRRMESRIEIALWLVLLVADLFLIDRSLIVTRPWRDAPPVEIETLEEWATEGRVFSPSYAIPQDVAAQSGLELADGVHPMQLRAYVASMASATGFDIAGYSVTLPPFPTGDPEDDWEPVIDADALGRWSVTRIVSHYPIDAPGLHGYGTLGALHVYSNPLARPRAWVEHPASGEWTSAEIVSRSPNHIVVTAEGPGRLVFSEVFYPGWQARLDGEEATIQAADGVLRTVDLPPGSHTVRLDFRPYSVYVGLALTLATLTSLLVLWRRTL
ncbi:MAG TPA: hypothetical protein VFI11_08185 [Anaerolineales bacterium]|nr:hypothetical protein [Anaerolineales bacterium]